MPSVLFAHCDCMANLKGLISMHCSLKFKAVVMPQCFLIYCQVFTCKACKSQKLCYLLSFFFYCLLRANRNYLQTHQRCSRDRVNILPTLSSLSILLVTCNFSPSIQGPHVLHLGHKSRGKTWFVNLHTAQNLNSVSKRYNLSVGQ